jgi:hypothetical protein
MSEGKAPPREGEDSVLMKRIDRALTDWPSREKTQLEWDESAEALVSRIASKEQAKSMIRVSDEDLLQAPLPSSPNDVQSSAALEKSGRSEGTMSTTPGSRGRERDRTSLQELAKMASLTPMAPSTSSASTSGSFAGLTAPAADAPRSEGEGEKKGNSGIIDLAAIAAADPQAQVRAKATPLAAQGLFDDDAPSAPKLGEAAAAAKSGPVAAAADAVQAVPAIAPAKAAAPAKKVDKDKKKGGGLAFLAIGGVVAAAAIVGGVFFGMHRGPFASTHTAANNPPAAPTQPAPTAPPVVAKGTPPVAPTVAGGVDPNQLPPGTGGGGATPQSVQGQPNSPPVAFGGGVKPPALGTGSAAPTPPPAPTPDPALVVRTVPTSTPAPGSPTDLQGLMQKEVGTTGGGAPPPPAGTDQQTQPAVAAGSVPLKPPMGAVQGAMGTVLPGARACLGPDDPVSHATITFKSDGSVQSVGVSGGASGKPAEGCIRGALMKAHVPPFANATFTWSATIRPN